MKTAQNRILFITQWEFGDALIQTYTLPYVYIIQKITSCYPYVVTVNEGENSIKVKKRGKIIFIELPVSKRRLLLRWLLNIFSLHRITRKKGIKVIHPWCAPAGAVGTVLKILNKRLKLYIDSFEPHAETMVENNTWKRNELKHRILSYFEKLEAVTADYLIFAAPGMEKYILEQYGKTVLNYSVKPACTDLEAFSIKYVKNPELVKKFDLENKIICVYAGKFGGIYLEEETFEFIKSCEKFWGKDKFRFLLLSNMSDADLTQKLSTFDIQPSSVIKLFVPHSEVPLYMGLADFAISPVKPIPSKKYCTPIKDGEYWAMGLPIVITTNISIDSEIIKENRAGAILESFDETAYNNVIKQIDAIIKGRSRTEIYNQIRPLAEKYRNFSIAEKVYSALYNS